MYNMTNIINTAVYYIWKLLKEQILRVLIPKKKMFYISLISYLYEMMDVQ